MSGAPDTCHIFSIFFIWVSYCKLYIYARCFCINIMKCIKEMLRNLPNFTNNAWNTTKKQYKLNFFLINISFFRKKTLILQPEHMHKYVSPLTLGETKYQSVVMHMVYDILWEYCLSQKKKANWRNPWDWSSCVRGVLFYTLYYIYHRIRAIIVFWGVKRFGKWAFFMSYLLFVGNGMAPMTEIMKISNV